MGLLWTYFTGGDSNSITVVHCLNSFMSFALAKHASASAHSEDHE